MYQENHWGERKEEKGEGILFKYFFIPQALNKLNQIIQEMARAYQPT